MASNYNPSIPTTGLLLFYDLGNLKSYPGSGTSLFDSSGNANTGTLIASPTFTSTGGGYLTFNGSTQYVTTSGNTVLLPTTGLTVSAWAYTGTADKFIVDKADSALTQGYYLAGTSAGPANFRVNTVSLAGVTNINNSTWRHIVGTWEPSSSIRIYINGVLDAITTTSIPASITNPSTDLWLARRRNGADMWNGRIGQVGVYNRALTDEEIIRSFTALRGRFGL